MYRARDPRLGRDVAIKVLPASFSQDADRLRRFEQEARAAGRPQPPQHHRGLRHRDARRRAVRRHGAARGRDPAQPPARPGRCPVRKALDYAIQIARGPRRRAREGDRPPGPEAREPVPDEGRAGQDPGLRPGQADAAETDGAPADEPADGDPRHRAGRRARDGRLHVARAGAGQARRPPLGHLRVRRDPLRDARRASARSSGDSAAETMTAILHEGAAGALGDQRGRSTRASTGSSRHCLEKNPEERFQSARDLAFDLEALSGSVGGDGRVAAVRSARRPEGAWLLPVLRAPLRSLAARSPRASSLGKKCRERPPPSSSSSRSAGARSARRGSRRTGRRSSTAPPGTASRSRSSPPAPDSPESRAVRPRRRRRPARSRDRASSPSRSAAATPGGVRADRHAGAVSLAGGARRARSSRTSSGPTGRRTARTSRSCATSRAATGSSTRSARSSTRPRLDQPPRVSPTGDRVAFLDHPPGDDGGPSRSSTAPGKARRISPEFARGPGPRAGRPDGEEVWFTAATRRQPRALRASTSPGASPAARARRRAASLCTTSPATAASLVAQRHAADRIARARPGRDRESGTSRGSTGPRRPTSPRTARLSSSPRPARAAASGYSVYVRGTEARPPVRLGEGAASLSPDGQVGPLDRGTGVDQHLVLYPTGAGEPQAAPHEGLDGDRSAAGCPDGSGSSSRRASRATDVRLYVQRLAGGKPRPLTPEGYRHARHAVSPDGRFVVATGPDGGSHLYPVDGGEPSRFPGVGPEDIRRSGGARTAESLYVHRPGELPREGRSARPRDRAQELWKDARAGRPRRRHRHRIGR